MLLVRGADASMHNADNQCAVHGAARAGASGKVFEVLLVGTVLVFCVARVHDVIACFHVVIACVHGVIICFHDVAACFHDGATITV